MNFEDVTNVCRLCLGKDRLMKVFYERIEIPGNMQDIIQTSTGVMISPSDDVSQKICHECVDITVKMFKFRCSSMVNDLKLKERAAVIKSRSLLHKSPSLFIPEIDTDSVVKIEESWIRNWIKKEKGITMEDDPIEENYGKLIMPEITDIRTDIPLFLEAEESLESSFVPEHLHDEVENGRKRKRTTSLTEPKTKKLKGNLDKETDIFENSFFDLKYVNEHIYLCDICNSILYNAKSLKKHRIKHMRCSLCKKTFRSFEETEEHSRKYCPIKHMMNNLPNIFLERCDQSKDIREQYASAFGDIYRKTTIEHRKKAQDPSDTISLISDDEDATFKPVQHQEILYDKSPLEKEVKHHVNDGFNRKPELEITGDNVFDLSLDVDEISLVRELLKCSKGYTKESSVQTDLPGDIISPLDNDKSFEIKNLRTLLNYYKIPVNVSYARRHSAKYGDDLKLLSKYHDISWRVLKEEEEEEPTLRIKDGLQNTPATNLVESPSSYLPITLQDVRHATNTALITDSSNKTKGNNVVNKNNKVKLDESVSSISQNNSKAKRGRRKKEKENTTQ